MEQCVRSFVFDSYRVYCDLLDGLAAPGHRSSNSETDRADRAADQFQKSSFAEISQRFRAVLAELNQSINAAAEALDQGQHKCARDADNLDEEYDMVCMVENLWRIAEVFCLNQSVVLSIEMAKLLKEQNHQGAVDLCLESMRGERQPELVLASSSIPFSYWSIVQHLVLQGRLVDACEALHMHSEIAEILETSSDLSQQLKALFDIFLSHPFAILLSDGAPSSGMSNFTSYKLSLNDWSERIRRLRNKAPSKSILSVVPELDSLLRIMMGEKTALTQACEGDWTKITLGLLLYVYPPPLSKANISQIMEEAVALCDDAGVSATFKYLSITREVMSGDVGSLLKYMYGRSVVYKVKSVHLSVVLLVSTVHLSILLAHGTNRPELLSPMLHTEGGDLPISFVTKVTLETVEALNQFETPVKVLLDYLRSSSSDCSHSLKEMLIDRIKQKLTDSSVLEVCDVLLESGLNSDRNSVLVERGMWWLQRGQHNPAIAFIQRGNSSSVAKITTPIKAEDVNEAEWLSNCVDFHINSYCQGSHNSTVAKAIHFFYLAGDMSRINILLEFTMWRCMSAVALCGDLFPGVTIVPPLPTPPSGMFTGSDASILSARGLNASQANSVQLLLLALEEAEEVIASIPGVEGVQAEDDSAMSMDSSAERWEIEEGERPEIEKWYMMRTASALRRYTFAIDLRIRALQALKEISDLNDKELHLHDTEVMDHCLSTAFNELSDSAKAILNILIPGDPGEMNGNYLLPIRYWLHALQLCAWLCKELCELDEKILACSANMANISIPRRSSAIVNKPQAYRLLTLLQMVQTHHSAARLSVGVSSQQLKDLGTDLLGILAASINYENAEVGDALEEIRQREKEKKLAALFGGKEKAKLPLTTEKIPNLPPSLQFLNKELMSPERCYEYLSGGLPF